MNYLFKTKRFLKMIKLYLPISRPAIITNIEKNTKKSSIIKIGFINSKNCIKYKV